MLGRGAVVKLLEASRAKPSRRSPANCGESMRPELCRTSNDLSATLAYLIHESARTDIETTGRLVTLLERGSVSQPRTSRKARHLSHHGLKAARLVSNDKPLNHCAYADLLYRRLYRHSLKLALDWAVNRYLWRGQAMYIRSLFEANKHITQPRQQRVRFDKCIWNDCGLYLISRDVGNH